MRIIKLTFFVYLLMFCFKLCLKAKAVTSGVDRYFGDRGN